MSEKLTSLLEELKQGLEQLYGERFVRLVLYGSQARNEATEDSDIDVMVILRGNISPGDEIFKVGGVVTELNLKYDELITVFPISELNFHQRQTSFMNHVRQEGIAV